MTIGSAHHLQRFSILLQYASSHKSFIFLYIKGNKTVTACELYLPVDRVEEDTAVCSSRAVIRSVKSRCLTTHHICCSPVHSGKAFCYCSYGLLLLTMIQHNAKCS